MYNKLTISQFNFDFRKYQFVAAHKIKKISRTIWPHQPLENNDNGLYSLDGASPSEDIENNMLLINDENLFSDYWQNKCLHHY